jgi:glycosyltransferase involved in cell wall biosynthesis
MRILFLTNLYPPFELGGYEQWCQEVAEGMRERGHQVLVLTSRYGTNRAELAETDVARTLHLQADLFHYRPVDFLRYHDRHERENQVELRRVLDTFEPEVAVVWGMYGLSRNLPFWLEQWMPDQVAYFISSYWPQDPDIHVAYWRLPGASTAGELVKRPLRGWVLQRLGQEGYPPVLRFDRALCCSQYVRDVLVDAGKLPPTAGVLFGGIDLEPFQQEATSWDYDGRRPLRLVYVGSLLPQKGVHTAIEAVGMLRQQGMAERVSLTIIGVGHPDYEARLHELVGRLGVGDRVHFVGRVPRPEIPSWLGRFDVFLFTSIWPEPMARTVMEAMAAGLLVIGTEVGGQVEMLQDDSTGLTFGVEDAEALSAQIGRVISDPAAGTRVAAAGQQMIEQRFTLDRMVSDFEAWLGSMVL